MNISSLTSFLVGAIWFIVFVTFGIVILRASSNQPTRGSGRVLTAMILFAVLLTTLNAGLVFIEPQERGVVISAVSPDGYRKEPLEPGLRFIIPFAEQVVRYSIANQTYTMSIAAREGQIEGDDSIAARTEDGQEIYVDASVIYAINPTEVVKVGDEVKVLVLDVDAERGRISLGYTFSGRTGTLPIWCALWQEALFGMPSLKCAWMKWSVLNVQN